MSQQASKILRASAKRGDPSNLFGPWAAKTKPYITKAPCISLSLSTMFEIVNELLTDMLSFPWWDERTLRMRACQLTWLSFIRKGFMHSTSFGELPNSTVAGYDADRCVSFIETNEMT